MHLPEKKSVNQLLLRCGFYGFALTQLNVMPSVHSGRFSKKRSLQSCTKDSAFRSKNSKNIYILTKELLLRCSLHVYGFALTQLILMPSVHSRRFSEIVHFYSLS